MSSPSLVIVDDEPELCQLTADYLGRHGFSVRSADGGVALDRCLAQQPADLLILDVNMPGEDGHSIARRLRARSSLPILMLTSAADITDRVAALEQGVDDYLLKPFDLRELRARLRAILRRAAMTAGAPPPPLCQPHGVAVGPLNLDLEAHCLWRRDGSEVPLTRMEFDLLEAFIRNPYRVLTRDRLLGLGQENDREPFDRSIDIRITRLRRKIEADPAHPQLIRTMRGVGYMFVPAATGAP